MKNLIKNLFNPSVQSLLGSITRDIARLQAHAERQANKSVQLDEQADALREQADAAAAESAHANRVIYKLQDIVA